jgi:hypothetical protein
MSMNFLPVPVMLLFWNGSFLSEDITSDNAISSQWSIGLLTRVNQPMIIIAFILLNLSTF